MHIRPCHDFIDALLITLALGAASGCSTLVGIEEGVLDSPCAPSDPHCNAQPEASPAPCPDCTLGCLPPWQLEDAATGHCYLLESSKKQWPSARDACEKIGGMLAAVTSAAELQLVTPLLRESTWIGASDLARRDIYAWSSDEPWWAKAPWVSGKPDSEGGKHCVKLSATPPIAFDNAQCGSKLAYLCEKL